MHGRERYGKRGIKGKRDIWGAQTLVSLREAGKFTVFI